MLHHNYPCNEDIENAMVRAIITMIPMITIMAINNGDSASFRLEQAISTTSTEHCP